MTTVKIVENGPAILTGVGDEMIAVVYSNDKTQMEIHKSVAICRCGKSKNQPYCDGSHKQKTEDTGAA